MDIWFQFGGQEVKIDLVYNNYSTIYLFIHPLSLYLW